MTVTERIEQQKIVPVVTATTYEDAEMFFKALIAGGLPITEVCFRTDCVEEVIHLAEEKYPDMIVDAGTIISGEQCVRAINVGAKFLVSPGISEETAFLCAQRHVPYFPGVVTATEIMRAISLGLRDLKFFPANNFGGLNTIKALCAAFPQVRFMPTGGVNLGNIKEYLSFSKIFAVGGSWMLKGTAAEIEENTRCAVKAVKIL